MRRALAPLAWLYGAGVAARNRRYDRVGGRRLPVPVVSVGNLSVGGSGKTPFVAAVARMLLERERTVAVLSRGYGRRSSARFVLVSDGRRVVADAREGGDEPVELARTVEGLAVAVGADRYETGLELLELLGPHVLVLDDGFQHRGLERDLDLVCVDCTESEEDRRLMPVGRLREPLSSLERADAIVLTQWSDSCAPPVSGLEAPVIRTRVRVTGFTRLGADEERLPASAFQGQPVGLMAAVARPERLERGLDATLVHRAYARDHHRFGARELRAIRDDAIRKGATALLTTGKDAVKLDPDDEFVSGSLPVYRIDIETELLDSDRLRELLAFAAL